MLGILAPLPGNRFAKWIGGTGEDVDTLQIRADRIIPHVGVLAGGRHRGIEGPGMMKAQMGKRLIVVLNIDHQRGADLAHVGEAGGHPRPLARLREDREEDRGQNGNNGYHHEKLDQGER